MQDRENAANYAGSNSVAKLQSQEAGLQAAIAAETEKIDQQNQDYAVNISKGIAAKAAIMRQQAGSIGLLNRIDALSELADHNPVIAVATVLLSIFIITIDCLPVLTKMLSGTTRYDRLVELRLGSAERMAEAELKVIERGATSRDEIALARIESEANGQLERIDEAAGFDRARRDVESDWEIARLATEYSRSPGQRSGG